MEKLLEDAQIKLSVVAADSFGVSGWAMMAALIAGERDPKVLAQLARGRLRAKLRVLEEALTGHFSDHHAFLLATMLARIDQISIDIATLEAKIAEEIAPFAATVDQLDKITGVGRTAAHVLIAEIGVDMRRFPTPAQLAAWARLAPRGHRVGPQAQRHGRHRPRQPVSGPGPRRGRRHCRQDQHLPRGALPAHRPPPWHQAGHRRGRPLHPAHRLAPVG